MTLHFGWLLLCKNCRHRVREIVADNLKKRGWSLGWVSLLDGEGQTIWVVDAHCNDGNRFVARADEKLAAFIELDTKERRTYRFRRNRVEIGNSS
jgi:hypothetical protein